MPNTVDYRTLRRMYQDKFGEACPLSTKRVTDLWASTRRSRATGAGVATPELMGRAAQTVDLMRIASQPVQPHD